MDKPSEVMRWREAAILHWLSMSHEPCNCGRCQPHTCEICTVAEDVIGKETLKALRGCGGTVPAMKWAEMWLFAK